MKKRLLKNAVAILSLVAMLTQNAYTAYAAMEGAESFAVEETVEATEETVEATEEAAVFDGDVQETVEENESEVNYDDQIMLLDEETTEETVEEIPVEVTEELEEAVDANVDILETQISGAGLDYIDVYVDTTRLSAKDSFRIIFTGAADARYNTELNDVLDVTSGGTYTFEALNKEGFNIRATSDDDVYFEYSSENGTPVIRVISKNTNNGKTLNTEQIIAKDGKPVTGIVGSGYENVIIKINSEDLEADAEYTVYVDTEADVRMNGEASISYAGSKSLKEIELSNLDEKDFTVYAIGNEGSEITVDASITDSDAGKASFIIEGRKERVKRVYKYSDADVTVTATCEYADAVPDDAEFVVTPITAQRAVDAYLDALNKNSSEEENEYTEENTLLYDIAFLVDKTDDEGNVIEGEKVEYEPEVGSVTIEIRFNKSQITDEIGALEAENVSVTHLPLAEDVKEAVDATIDATNIDASDIIVEPMKAEVTVVENGADKVTFTADSFSAYAVSNGKSSKWTYYPGNSVSYKSVLGDAINYGVTANVMNHTGHIDANFAAGTLTSNVQITGGKFTNDKRPGNLIIGEYTGTGFFTDSGSEPFIVYTTEDAKSKFSGSMTSNNANIMFNTTFTAQELKDQVKDLVDGTASASLASEAQNHGTNSKSYTNDSWFTINGGHIDGWLNAIYNSTSQKYVIDLRDSADGTYYFNFAAGEYASTLGQADKLYLYIKSSQNVVFNLEDVGTADSPVTIQKYQVSIDGKNPIGSDTSDGSANPYVKRIFWNFPNAKYVSASNTFGTFLAPQADFTVGGTSTGWVVCNKFAGNSGEWHGVWDEMPTPVTDNGQFNLRVEKNFLDVSEWPESLSSVQFKLEQLYRDDEKYHAEAGDFNWGIYQMQGSNRHVISGPQYLTINRPAEGTSASGQFSTITFNYSDKDLDGYNNNNETFKQKTQCYFFKVSEVIPCKDDAHKLSEVYTETLTVDGQTKTVTWPMYKDDNGVIYIDAVRYVKIWVNYYEGWVNGTYKKWVTVDPMWSNSNQYCCHSFERLTFNNKYEAPKGSLKVTKVVVPTGHSAGETFRFIVKNSSGATVGGIREITAGQTVEVTDLVPGTYTVVEVDANGNEIANNGQLGKYKVTYTSNNVTVQNGKTGNQAPTATITNTFEDEATITINGIKKVTPSSYTLKAGTFGFTMIGSSGAPMPYVMNGATKTNVTFPVYNAANGTVNFGTIKYTQADIDKTYTYTISEVSGTDTHITYSGETYTLTVSVTGNSNGINVSKTLTKTGSVEGSEDGVIDGDTITVKFLNQFTSSIPLGFKAVKTLTGRNLSANEFEFKLEGPAGKMPAGAVNGVLSKKNSASTNGTPTVIDFGTVNYSLSDVGTTYTYTVYEVQKNGNGLACDTTVYTVTVTPRLNSDNQMYLDKTVVDNNRNTVTNCYESNPEYVKVPFNNTYEANGNKQFTVRKSLSANAPQNVVFEFELFEGTNTTAKEKVSVTGAGTANFTTINYTLAQARELNGAAINYTVKEVQPVATDGHPVTQKTINGKTYNVKDGIIYDPSEVHFSVTLADDGNGTVVPTVKDASGNEITGTTPVATFSNDYGTTPVTEELSGRKTLSGKTIGENKYKIKVEKYGNSPANTPMPNPAEVWVSAANDTYGEYSFGTLTYDTEGTYVYKVSEVDTDVDGVTYDVSYYIATITVTDNHKGALTASKSVQKYVLNNNGEYVPSGDAGEVAMDFANTYDAAGDVTFTATKTVEGGIRTPQSGQFEFGIYVKDEGNNYVPLTKDGKTYTCSNVTTNVTFPTISYKLDDLGGETSKDFTYYLHEIEGNLTNYTYDPEYYEVTVTVVDNGDGTLTATNTSGTVPEFENGYSAKGDIVISATKNLQGGDAKQEYTFSVTLTPFETNVNDTNVAQSKTVTVKGNNSATVNFDKLEYTKVGTYKYTVSEVTTGTGIYSEVIYDTTSYEVVVTVADNPAVNGKLLVTKTVDGVTNKVISFNNKIPVPDGTSFSATKNLSGRPLKNEEFTFTIKEVKDGSYSGYSKTDAKNNADGYVDLGSVTYTKADEGQHVYEIKEVIPSQATAANNYTYKHVKYDNSTWYAVVDVSVSDDGSKINVTGPTYHKDSPDGTAAAIVFNNEYTASQSVVIEGVKKLYYDEDLSKEMSIGEREFTFTLTGSDGVSQTVKNSDNGNYNDFVFAPINYTQDSLTDGCKVTVNGKDKYYKYYTVTESGHSASVDNDTTEYTVVVVLWIDNNGDIQKNVFSYVADKEKTKLTEVIEKVRLFFDNNNDVTNIIFKNRYSAEGHLDLSVTKVFEGRTWDDDLTFEFELRDATSIVDKVENWINSFIKSAGNAPETVTVDNENKTKSFARKTYDLSDLGGQSSKTFTYLVNEKIPATADQLPGVAYDENVYRVEAVVSDTLKNGKLSIVTTVYNNKTDEVVYNSAEETDPDDEDATIMVCAPDSFEFTNTYEPTPIDINIEGTKVLTGRTFKEGETFTFEISPVNGAPLRTADGTVYATTATTTDGSFAFGNIHFIPSDLDGVTPDATGFRSRAFEYVIREVIPEVQAEGMTYDDNSYTVTITVSDDKTGEMKAEVTYPEGGLQFTNTFDKPGSTSFSVKKTVNGTSDTTKKFKFTFESLTEGDPNRSAGTNVIDTVEVVNGETKAFKTLNYTLQDVLTKGSGSPKTYTYSYKITEDSTAKYDYTGYSLSKQEYLAEVKLTANADGTLTIDKSLTEVKDFDGATVSKAVSGETTPARITNKYEASGSTDVILTKAIEGRKFKDDDTFTFILQDEEGNELDSCTIDGSKKDETGKVIDTYVFAGDYFSYSMEDLAVYDEAGNKTGYAERAIKYYTISEVPGAADCGIEYDSSIYVVAVVLENDGQGSLGDSDRKCTTYVNKFNVNSCAKAIENMAGYLSTEKNPTSLTAASFVNKYDASNSWDPYGRKELSGKSLTRGDYTFELVEYKYDDKKADFVLTGNRATAVNGMKGSTQIDPNEVRFSPDAIEFLTYGLDDQGQYKYIFREVQPVATEGHPVTTETIDGKTYNVQDGVRYDPTEYVYIINVSDPGTGTLSIDYDPSSPNKAPQIDGDEPFFTSYNKYEASGDVELVGTKKMLNRELLDGEKYNFVIKDLKSGSTQTKTITNDGESIVFNKTNTPFLQYYVNDTRNDVGTHEYQITEELSTVDGVESDKSVYKIKVTVEDNGDGTLHAYVKNLAGANSDVSKALNSGLAYAPYDADSESYFVFKNTYSAEASLDLTGIKHLVRYKGGADVKSADELEGKFQFVLYEYENEGRTGERKYITSAMTDKDGKYTLKVPKYTQDSLEKGTYYYQVVEGVPSYAQRVDGKIIYDGVTYDQKVYNINVKVEPIQNSGKLQLTVTMINSDGTTVTMSPTVSDKSYFLGGFDFTNIKPQYTEIYGRKTWVDSVTDPSTRPDVTIRLHQIIRGVDTEIDKYTIVAPSVEYKFTNLPVVTEDGDTITYRVTEDPIDGYFSEQYGYNFTNTSGDILIRKIDATTGAPLEGAVLAILNAAGTEIERWTTTTSAHVVEAKLEPGVTYTLHEVSAPRGYIVAPDQTFTVPTDGKDIVITMEDPRIKANLRLVKLDQDTRIRLTGAEFALYTESGERVYASVAGTVGTYRYSESASNGRFLVNTDGELTITDLPYGTYYFVETVAPAGYEINPERIAVSVLDDGATYEVTCLDPKSTGSVRLVKTNVAGSRTLAGATFELYAKTPTSASAAVASTIYSGAYYRVGTYTSDASGSIYVGDLPWDDYYFIETVAPTGYTINTDTNGDPIVYTFTISDTSTRTLSIDLGRITNTTTTTTPPPDSGRRSGGVLSGVLGVRAAPTAGVLGERVGPVTGDSANIALWLLLLIACVSTIVGILVSSRRRSRRAR